MGQEALDRLRALLKEHEATFREVPHPPADSAEAYHRIVGSRLEQQAKALLLRTYGTPRDYAVVAIPGHERLDLARAQQALGARRVRMATRKELEEATGCRFGELPPFGSLFGLPTAIAPSLLVQEELFFNAGVLDRSIVLPGAELARIEAPARLD